MSTTSQDSPASGVALESHPAAKRRNPALRGPVLLATDGTSQSGAAVVAACLISERLGLPLEVVTVLEPQLVYSNSTLIDAVPVYLPELEQARKETQMFAVRDYVARYSGATVLAEVHMRLGTVAHGIADVARQRSATLIVVGSAPHRRMDRTVAGERAVQVLRASTVPVLSVPPGFSTLPQRIVAAVDFSPASVRAAETALLLLAGGGTLTLVHVLSPLVADARLRDVRGGDPASMVQGLFVRFLDELRPSVPDAVTIETRVKTDLHIDGILDAAADVGAELVAVGTHGPRLLERLFVGSAASTIVHTAPQAVLAVPPPPAADALELSMRITGTATSTRPKEWTEALDAFTRRNTGRRVAIEVDDPEIGAQMLGRGALLGVTYDPHDHRVEIMLGDVQQTRRHLMHSIPDVESIAMTAEERGGAEALELRHGHGQTLVLVGP